MNTLAESVPNAAPEIHAAAAAAIHPVRPFLWSVRRELWETRSIYVAPLIAAGVFLFGCLVSARRVGPWLRHMEASAQSRAAAAYAPPFFGDMVILGTALVVAVFYCLGALHNERRDRSILFWKSLPVSDLTTVASKAAIPLVVLPIVTLAIALVTHLIVVGLDTAVLASTGLTPQGVMHLSLLDQLGMLIYGVFTLTLWHAPAYAWFLLVSVWARRAPFLWAFGLPIAATIFENVAFGTSVVGNFFWKRLMGGLDAAFGATHHSGGEIIMPQIDPVGFFGNPGLWVGFVVAAAMLAGCVWLRRYREPV